MSVSGLCEICESRTAEQRCRNCGTFACQAHYEPGKGLCADCAATAQPARHDETDINRF